MNLKEKILEFGLTQQKVADETGLTKHKISAYCNEKIPMSKVVAKMFEFYFEIKKIKKQLLNR